MINKSDDLILNGKLLNEIKVFGAKSSYTSVEPLLNSNAIWDNTFKVCRIS